MRRLLFCSAVLFAISCRSGTVEAPPGYLMEGSENYGEATRRSLSIDVAPHAGLPTKAKLLFIGLSDDQLDDGKPQRDTVPFFFWKSDTVKIASPLEIEAPLPDSINLIVVIDADGNGRPGPQERTSKLMLGIELNEAPAIVVDRFFADLGGPSRTGPKRTIRIDASALESRIKGKVTPLILAYPEDGLRGGQPRAGAIPTFMHTGKPMRFAPQMSFEGPVPDVEEADALLVLDTDGNGLPSPEEPISIVAEDFRAPPQGVAWEVTIDRLFTPSREPRNPEMFGGEADGRSLSILIDAEPRIPVTNGASFLFVGYDQADVAGGKPMSDSVPAFYWRRLESEMDWPLAVDARVPRDARWMVVMDMDGDAQPSLGDLSTELYSPFDPKTVPAEFTVVLDRTLTFSDSDAAEDDSKESR